MAQSKSRTRAAETTEPRDPVLPLSLRYDEPKTYPAGTNGSLIISDFRCGSDGTVFVQMFEDASALSREGLPVDRANTLLHALTPSGDVVRFPYAQIPGFRRFLPTVRFFVSPSRVYTLERADIYDESDPKHTLGVAYVILVYDYKGAYRGFIRLEPGLNPLNIAAFPSGDVLVVSIDKLNQTTRLLIFDSAGRPVKELKLFDEDYMLKLQLAENAGKTGSSSNNEPWRKLALAEWVPFGENLLLGPTDSRLPLIEINENGVVRSTNAVLSEGSIFGALVGSSDKLYHLLVGRETRDQARIPADASSASPSTGFMPEEIDDMTPGGSTLLKRVRFAPGLMPVCAQDDTYTFIAPRGEDGKLQLIRGTAVH